jgi:iduronate 2-sulfatase
MNSRIALHALVLVSALPLFARAAGPPPNVLLICVDDLKPVLGCYGDTHAKTPNLDALAARSLRLDRAYCNQAVCSPSRNALMTSLRPQTLGIYDLPTNFRKSRPDAVTVAQYFQQHGYRTEAMGKIMHVGHGNGEDEASWTVPHFKPKAKQYAIAENDAPKPDKKNPGEPWKDPRGTATESADVPDETYGDGQIALEAVRRLRAAGESGEPFFMGVGFLKPHLPFIAPKKYWDRHDPATLPQPGRDIAPEGAPEYAGQPGGELRQYAGIPGGREPLDADLTRHLIHGYYAATSYMDAQLGLVLAALEETGLADNTIVVLWGDHGWHLGDHGMWCKHTNYEQAARIPLMIALPGKEGTVSSALVETVDIYPTLTELAGLPAPEGLDGKSFAALFKDPAVPHRDHAIHVYPRNKLLGRAIRTDRYRLVEWKEIGSDPAGAEWELYDYESDPGETKNLVSAKPEIVKDLQALLATHPEAKPQIKAIAPVPAAKPTAKPKSGKQDRVGMFRKRDTDGDGKLSREEFLLNQPDPDEAPKRFPVFDANNNGSLSEEEFVTGGKIAKP